MSTTTVKPREASIVSDRHLRNIMGFPVWEALPARDVPYELSDPFLLVHEATLKISPAMANLDTEHPHRGFDNLWYVLKGTTSTGHTTGPAGKIERARLPEGSFDLPGGTGRVARAGCALEDVPQVVEPAVRMLRVQVGHRGRDL